MTRRLRNTIVDNTTGKVLSGTDISTDTSDHVVAALVPKQLSIEVKSPGSIVQVVTATKAWKPSSSGVITKITGVLRTSSGPGVGAAPIGQNLTFRIRQQHSDSTNDLYSYSIASGSFTSSTVVNINFVPTDNIYLDITQVGATRPGQGLIVYLEYYLG